MSDELDEIQADVTNGQSTQIERDEAFCASMRAAIEAGLENAPIGVVTAPGTIRASCHVGAADKYCRKPLFSLVARGEDCTIDQRADLASHHPAVAHGCDR